VVPPVQCLRLLPATFTVSHHPEPVATPAGDWWALVRTPHGVTVIAETHGATDDTDGERWSGLHADDAHGLDLPGMLAALVGPLAAAGIAVFVASTFHADLLLVPHSRRAEALGVLRRAGHTVLG
jgi:uncharacterized protein